MNEYQEKRGHPCDSEEWFFKMLNVPGRPTVNMLDIEFLRPLQVGVDVAYGNWSKSPTNLSYIRNLRRALDALQDATIDQLTRKQ